MASLFGKNKLRDIASKLSTSDLEDKIAIVKTWHHDYHNGNEELRIFELQTGIILDDDNIKFD